MPLQYTAECIFDSANRLQFRTASNTDAIMVTTEFYYPGWSAKVDGKIVDILEIDYSFRGIYLPAGEHTIEFSFFPVSLKISILLFIIALGEICLCIYRDKKQSNL